MNQFNDQTEMQCVRLPISRAIGQALCWLCIVSGSLISTPLFAQTEESSAVTTFLVVRHAERDGDMDKLTKAGEERSRILATVGSALNVQAIYSTDTQRTRGTVEPLAEVIDTEIQLYEKPSAGWINELKGKHAGQVVLIVGHSNTAGVIAGLLGGREPFEIAHDEYNALFVIQVTESDTQCMRLKYGSSTAGAPSAAPDKMGAIDSIRESK